MPIRMDGSRDYMYYNGSSNSPYMFQYSVNEESEKKMNEHECSICHRTLVTVNRLMNGYICYECWPSELGFMIRFSATYLYKPDEPLPPADYDIVYMIVHTPFAGDVLDKAYTTVFLSGASGTINTLSHDRNIITKVSLKINEINAPSYDMNVTLCGEATLEMDDVNVRALSVDCLLSRQVKINDCTIQAITIAAPTSASPVTDLLLNNLRGNRLVVRYLNKLTTINTKVQEFSYSSITTWIANNTHIDDMYLPDNDDVFYEVFLEDTTITNSESVLHARYGKVINCTLTVMNTAQILIEGGLVKKEEIQICGICKQPIFRSDFIPNHVNKHVHVNCWRRDGSRSSNSKYKGQQDNLPTFSIELELNGTERDEEYTLLIYDLLENGFIRCSDGTVTDEFKSPIFNSLDALYEIQSLLNRAIPYVNNRCRTHVHVGASQALKELLCQNHPLFFNPTGDWLDNHYDVVRQFFGCAASQLCSYYHTGDRFCWVNPATPYPTIEYRLSMLTSWQQFIRLIKFFREFTVFLETKSSIPIHHTRWPKTKEKAGIEILNYIKNYIEAFFHEEMETEQLTPDVEPFNPGYGCGVQYCTICYPPQTDDSEYNSVFDDDID